MAAQATAENAQARALELEGRRLAHKRNAAAERKKARDAARELDEFITECRQNGVEVVLVPSISQPPAGRESVPPGIVQSTHSNPQGGSHSANSNSRT